MITVFATLNPALEPVELFPGQGFRSDWYRVTDEAERDIYGAPIGDYAAAEIEHGPGALALFQPEDLDRFRVWRLEIDDPAEGHRIEGYALTKVGDEVLVSANYGVLPATRREVPKSVIQARLIAAGKMEAVFAVLMSSPADFAKWFAPDWPNVFADDERMLEVLTTVGADIPTITAP